ncbi:MAG: hypothetical protein Q9224_007138, partial [Gallowayella concinna]
TWLLKLGGFFSDHGRWSQARDLFLRALHIREKIVGTEHVEVSIACAEVGRCLEHLGDDRQAAGYWSWALKSGEIDMGLDKHVTTAWTKRSEKLLIRLQRKADGNLLVNKGESELAETNASEGDEDEDDDVTLIEEIEYPGKVQDVASMISRYRLMKL